MKRARKLREDTSFRKKEQRAILSGKKILEELAPFITCVCGFVEAGKPPLPFFGEATYEVPSPLLQKITGHPAPDGYAAEVVIPEPTPLSRGKLLLLDAVQDPTNIGAIVRSACAFGLDGVLCLPGCADLFHERALQAGRGVQFHLPYCNVSSASLPDLPCFGAAVEGAPIHELVPPSSFLLAMGNEGHGLSAPLAQQCSLVQIPIQGVESLNVSVAAGILLYELTRDR